MDFNEERMSVGFFVTLTQRVADRIEVVEVPAGGPATQTWLPRGIFDYMESVLEQLLDYVATRGGTELKVRYDVNGERPTILTVRLIDNGPPLGQDDMFDDRSGVLHRTRHTARSLDGDLTAQTTTAGETCLRLDIPFNVPIDWVPGR